MQSLLEPSGNALVCVYSLLSGAILIVSGLVARLLHAFVALSSIPRRVKLIDGFANVKWRISLTTFVNEVHEHSRIWSDNQNVEFLRVISDVKRGLCLRRISLSFRCPTGMGMTTTPVV